MSPVLILIVAALLGLPSILRKHDPDEPPPVRRGGVKAWWF